MFSRKEIKLSDALKKEFSVDKMGPGLKRGMVLKITPAKIKEVTGSKKFIYELKSIILKGKYDNPQLVIYMKAGSLWRVQIHQHRYQIKKKINERLKSEFIKDVKVY